MGNREILESLSKERLIELIDIYAKNWLALDGVWFQSIEGARGMDEAMFHDQRAWERFTAIEARRIKSFLKLPKRPGLQGLEAALRLRFYGSLNKDRIEYVDGKLIYTMVDCRVQSARRVKGMGYHPCKSVGIIEYSGFAKAIDDRIECRCISCYPQVTDDTCACRWEFSIDESEESLS